MLEKCHWFFGASSTDIGWGNRRCRRLFRRLMRKSKNSKIVNRLHPKNKPILPPISPEKWADNPNRSISPMTKVVYKWNLLTSTVYWNINHIGGFQAISGDTNNNGEMNKCWWTRTCGGQTKRANERSFVYRPPAWRRWRNVKTTYCILFT